MTNAAFANAISSHALELDDIDVLALFHFSPPVYSAALAAAEAPDALGKRPPGRARGRLRDDGAREHGGEPVAAQPRLPHDADHAASSARPSPPASC